MKKPRKSVSPDVDAKGSPEYEAFKAALRKVVSTPKNVVDARHAEWKARRVKPASE